MSEVKSLYVDAPAGWWDGSDDETEATPVHAYVSVDTKYYDDPVLGPKLVLPHLAAPYPEAEIALIPLIAWAMKNEPRWIEKARAIATLSEAKKRAAADRCVECGCAGAGRNYHYDGCSQKRGGV